jgi:CHAT domain-containing protein
MFSAAELQFADAIRMHASLWPEDRSGRADLQSERALNLSNQRRFAEAQKAFREARSSADASGDGFMIGKVAGYEALAALNENRLEEMMSLSDIARGRLEDWLRSGAAEGAPYDQASGLLPPSQRAMVLVVQLMRAQGLTLARMGEEDKAREAFRAAVRGAGALDDRAGGWLLAGVAQDAAALELASKRPEEARRILSSALETYRRGASRTRVEANLLMDLGGSLDALGRRAEAFEAFGSAFAIYREQPENRGVGVARGEPYLSGLAEAYLASGRDSDAEALFNAFETITSPAVAQTAAATAARLLAGENGDIIRSWQDGDRALRRSLTRLSALPVDAPAVDRAAAEDAVSRGRSELLRLQAEVDRTFPNYGVVTLEPVQLSALQAALGPGEATIRFAIGSNGGVGMIINKTSVHAFQTQLGESDVTNLVTRIKTTVRDPDADFDAVAAHELFEALFGPIQTQVFGRDAPKRLIIEASGALASLPFGVLLTKSPEEDPEAWFAKSASLVSIASMRAFVSTRAAGPSRGSAAFAGFGDFTPLPASPADAERLASTIVGARKLPERCVGLIQEALRRLPALPGTAAELEAVKAATGAREEDVYLRERFTDDAVLESSGVRAARVVMFSTHGVFASDFPNERDCLPEAALLTSASEGAGSVFLDSARVLDLKLDADLVVLSACDTGNPEPIAPGETGLPSGGDALSGLARSFFYAGARSVLVSHWVLPDEDTVALMKGFFERLTRGESAPEALRGAQMAQIESGAGDPLQWAAFTIVGAPPAI